jgi:uncharacterized protein
MACESRFPLNPGFRVTFSPRETNLALLLHSKTVFLDNQSMQPELSGRSQKQRTVSNMKKLDVIAAALVMVGALNWGLVGVFHLDLVATIFGMKFGETSALSSAVYVLVGLAGLYQALTWKAIQRRWDGVPSGARA